MKKILLLMKDLRIGNGVAACIMNYYEATVKSGFQIDFLLCRCIDSPYMDKVTKLGSNVYVLPHKSGKLDKINEEYMRKILCQSYDIVHVNVAGITAVQFLFEAKRLRIPMRIYHAHNPRENSSVKAYVRSLIYETPCIWLSNRFLACSSTAGDSLFNGRKYSILTNAMNTEMYKFDDKKRTSLRKEFGLTNEFVIGVVARMTEQKNPFFIIDVFKKIREKRCEAILLWVGEGDLREKVEKYAFKSGVEDSCLFLGTREDVNKLYSVMDVFLLPSFFEGLGLVFIEAQISGLTCFGSESVPSEVDISGNMFYVDVKQSANRWADLILQNSEHEREDYSQCADEAGYNIKTCSHNLLEIYNEH